MAGFIAKFKVIGFGRKTSSAGQIGFLNDILFKQLLALPLGDDLSFLQHITVMGDLQCFSRVL